MRRRGRSRRARAAIIPALWGVGHWRGHRAVSAAPALAEAAGAEGLEGRVVGAIASRVVVSIRAGENAGGVVGVAYRAVVPIAAVALSRVVEVEGAAAGAAEEDALLGQLVVVGSGACTRARV